MILESFDYAEEDFRKRQVAEARVEAGNILLHVEKAKQSPAWQQLSHDERRAIAQCEAELKRAQATDEYHGIRQATEALNQATHRLAELMMDSAVTGALKGKSLSAADVGEGPSAPHPFAPAEITSGERRDD